MSALVLLKVRMMGVEVMTAHASISTFEIMTVTQIGAAMKSQGAGLSQWISDLPSQEAFSNGVLWLSTFFAFAFSLLAVLWILERMIARAWRWIRVFSMRGVGYVLEEVDEPPGSIDVGRKVRVRILDELRAARKGPRTFTNLDGPSALIPPSFPELPDPYKWLAPALQLVASRRQFTIKVTALSAEADRITLQVRLSNSTGKLLESHRFDQGSADGHGELAYTRVAMRAGAWLVFMLARHTQARRLGYGYGRVVIFGTASWESYGFLRCGLNCQDDDERRSWLEASLLKDPDNIGAHLELGRLGKDWHSGVRGVENLRLAKTLLAREAEESAWGLKWLADTGTRASALWYQVCYNLTIAYTNRYYYRKYTGDSFGALCDLCEARKVGFELTSAVGATQLTLSSWIKRQSIKSAYRTDLTETLHREGVDLATVVSAAQAAHEFESGNIRPVDNGWAGIWEKNIKKFWELLPSVGIQGAPSSRSLLEGQFCMSDYREVPPNEAHHFLPELMRYQRACTLFELGDYLAAAEEFDYLFSRESNVSGFRHARWFFRDPALWPLWNSAQESMKLNFDSSFLGSRDSLGDLKRYRAAKNRILGSAYSARKRERLCRDGMSTASHNDVISVRPPWP